MVEVGKSRETEQKEAEDEKKAVQKKVSRSNPSSLPKTPQIRRSEQKQPVSVEIIGKSNEECVIYVRRVTGNAKIRGYAGNLKPEGQEYQKGAAVLFRNQGHVGHGVDRKPGFTLVEDTNWEKGKVTRHWVADSNIRGYIY